MNKLALIPARGGSKGVPQKNLIRIDGETLTARAARCAKEAGIFDKIIVSTDDAEIAKEAEKGGAEIPTMRPAELASDQSHIIDAITHMDGVLKSTGYIFDLIVLLEPTAPLRTPDIIIDTVDLVINSQADSGQTISVVPDNYRPVKQMLLDNRNYTSAVIEMPKNIYRRQDLPVSYIRNGMAYVMTRDCIINQNKIIGAKNVGYVTSGPSVNIDWPEDVELLHKIIKDK